MKKLLLLFLFCTQLAYANSANVTIINANNQHDMLVTYRISDYDKKGNLLHAEEKTVTLTAGKGKQMIEGQSSNDPNVESSILDVMSAVEKDSHGNVLSTGDFVFKNAKQAVTSTCSSDVYARTGSIKQTSLRLNDGIDAGYIVCMHK